ncbi:hypothetical protein WJX81_000100 [Elliptochloris bilobata]|uniref:Uncharacterized protein n=1 Tax=Elliptochloris bilobata TaxID=381761 RepID=A0AAW1S3U4_9CHLO
MGYIEPLKLRMRGTTVDCLKVLRQETGIAFTETLYFDDVASVRGAEALGATGVRLRSGLSCATLESGLKAFEQRGMDSRGY